MFYVKFFWRFLKVVEMFIDAVSDKKCLKLFFKGQIKSVILQWKTIRIHIKYILHFCTFLYIFFPFFHKNTALKHKSVKNPVRNEMTCENIFLSVLESLVDLSEIWYLFEPKLGYFFPSKSYYLQPIIFSSLPKH